jgi:hypothetical protein
MHDLRVHSGLVRVPGQAKTFGKFQGALADNAIAQEIFKELVQNFTVGQTIKWKAAFQAHPEWKEAFADIPVPTQFYWGRVWKKKLASSLTPSLGLHGSAQHTDAQRAVVEQLVQQYDSTGFIDWKRAFAEHPEWAAQLSNIKKQTLYSLARRIQVKRRKTGQSSALAVVPAQASPAMAFRSRAKISQMTNSTNSDSLRVCYCPHCGENILMWHKVAEVMQGL